MNRDLCSLKWLKSKKRKNYSKDEPRANIVDLFSGCGGLTLGALEGFYANGISCKVKLAVEHNESSARVYSNNFGACLEEIYTGDVERIIPGDPGDEMKTQERELKSKLGNIDVVLAGPPCQGHSRLNNHTRSRDPRNELYLKVIRLVEICRPRYVIIENVLNIKYDSNNVLGSSESFLESIGYSVENITVKIAEYGVAQKRVRHIQVASLYPFNLDFSKGFYPVFTDGLKTT